MSIEEKQKYIDNVKNNIVSVWNSFKTSDGNSVNASNVVVIEAPKGMSGDNLKANENLILVGKGLNANNPIAVANKTSFVRGDKLNQGYFFYEKEGNEAAHEFGHMLGLSDRYAEGANYDNRNGPRHGLQDRFTIPLMFENNYDPSYNPYKNLMACTGIGLSIMQQDLIFDGAFNKERAYPSPCLVLNIHDRDKKPDYQSIKVTISAHNIKVTPYLNLNPVLDFKTNYLQYIWKNHVLGDAAEEAAKCNVPKTKQSNQAISDQFTH